MTPEERKSYAKALGHQQPGATWTNIPPVLSGRQVAGTSGTTGLGILGLGKYEMPDGSSQVSWGLAQPALDAYRSMRYGLGYEQDPNAPPGYVSEEAISRGASGAAGAMATGGISATTAARAAARPAVPAARPVVPVNSLASLGTKAKGAGVLHKHSSINGRDKQAVFSRDTGDEVGDVLGEMTPDGFEVHSSYLNPEFRGQGIGLDMYRQLIDRIHSSGNHVKSDTVVSSDASKIYRRLKALGYDVRENPDPQNMQHMYRVAKPGTTGSEFFSSGIPGFHATEEDY